MYKEVPEDLMNKVKEASAIINKHNCVVDTMLFAVGKNYYGYQPQPQPKKKKFCQVAEKRLEELSHAFEEVHDKLSKENIELLVCFVALKDGGATVFVAQEREEQCKRLWDDIVFLEKYNKEGHFIGSIVCVVESTSISGISKFMVIDGQQRLTTLTILLIALRDFLASKNVTTSISRKFLKNDTENDKYKLALTYNDKDVLIKLVENAPVDGEKNSRIIDAYNYFYNQISSSDLTQEQIESAIAKLQIVNIILDASDNPQSIFESLNSTEIFSKLIIKYNSRLDYT